MRSVTSFRASIFLKLLACACAGMLVASAVPADAAGKKPRKEASAKRTAKKAPQKPKAPGYSPPYAALVVDAKTGKVLFSDSADETRHPASLTKVMTLYLLFDELDRGALTLKTQLTASAEAARQAPSKLGLRAGDTIMVEDAIKALVTKSANDVAVTIAENIAGSEAAFAQRMTRKARALGMTSTMYRNASGLPNPEQVTSARDLVILGRAIQDNHPNYYGYFATKSFAWRGQVYSNHNKLLGSVKGVDGIKTGYVRASGFNLLTSAQQNGRQVVAVVLGGRSSSSRDAHMRDLIQTNIAIASAGPRTAPRIAEAPMPAEPMPVLATARASAPSAAPAFAPATMASVPMPAPRPLTAAVPTLPQPVMAAFAASAPKEPVEDPAPQSVRLAQIDGRTAAPQIAADAPRSPTMTPDAIAQRIANANAMVTTTTPSASALGWKTGAQPVAANAYAGTTPGTTPRPQTAAPVAVASAAPAASAPVAAPAPIAASPVIASAPVIAPAPVAEPEPVQMAENEIPVRSVKTLAIRPPVEASLYPAPLAAPAPAQQAAPVQTYAPAHPVVSRPAAMAPAPAPQIAAAPMPQPAISSAPPRPGWMIQIAASPDRLQAEQLLERAVGAVKSADRKAEPYTEPVQKDGVTLYRARFAGLNEQSAVQACKAVKRASMSCFTLKN
ncbi:D-alanyl-D-alanine carboxypeptidase family protein [Terrihabitans soli]|nr:D-alanyl-D-alanine carboxypeptidase family protein [Terrihabitans soli]